MVTLQTLMELLSDRTKLETYIITFWFLAITMFNVGIYWIYIPISTGLKVVLTIIVTYVSYNTLKTYTHTRTLLETEIEPQNIQEPK